MKFNLGNDPIDLFIFNFERILTLKIMLTTEARETLNFYFQKPCRAIFSGSSQSGKTYLVGKILEQQKQLFNDEFVQISYFYEWLKLIFSNA